MIGRTSPALALTLLALGLILGGIGLFDEEGVYTRAGILIALGSMPPLIVWQSQRAHYATADQLAAEHDAGYRLALEHVARGLLDQPPAAPPDGGDRAAADNDRADHSDNDRAVGEQPCKIRRLFAVDEPQTTRRTSNHQDNPHEKRTGT